MLGASVKAMGCMKTSLTNILDPTRRSKDASDFENAMRRKVVGQDQAIEKVVEIYQTFLAGLNPPGRGATEDLGVQRNQVSLSLHSTRQGFPP
jgi:hypothetical protein